MMVLNIHVPGAMPYEIGDEIWRESLSDAIRAEAEIIVAYAGADLLESPDQAHRDALRDRLTVEMTAALAQIGDQYRSPDGVLYSFAVLQPIWSLFRVITAHLPWLRLLAHDARFEPELPEALEY